MVGILKCFSFSFLSMSTVLPCNGVTIKTRVEQLLGTVVLSVLGVTERSVRLRMLRPICVYPSGRMTDGVCLNPSVSVIRPRVGPLAS